MKKICISLLILVVFLTTGCSLKTSVTETDSNLKKDKSELQKEVESLVSKNVDDTEINEKIDNYNNAINDIINNINQSSIVANNE